MCTTFAHSAKVAHKCLLVLALAFVVVLIVILVVVLVLVLVVVLLVLLVLLVLVLIEPCAPLLRIAQMWRSCVFLYWYKCLC